MIKLKREDFYPGSYFIKVLNKLFGKNIFTKINNDYSEDILATEKGVANYVNDEKSKIFTEVDNKIKESNQELKEQLEDFVVTRGYVTENDVLDILIKHNVINVLTDKNNTPFTDNKDNILTL